MARWAAASRPVPSQPVPELITANGSLGLRSTGEGEFDYTPAAGCAKTPGAVIQTVEGVRRTSCEAACASSSLCRAAAFVYPTGDSEARQSRRSRTTIRSSPPPPPPQPPLQLPPGVGRCVLYSRCLERTRALPPARVDLLHRWGPTWPQHTRPRDVQWGTNATLVIVSFRSSLDWLRTLPGGILDLVIYHKGYLDEAKAEAQACLRRLPSGACQILTRLSGNRSRLTTVRQGWREEAGATSSEPMTPAYVDSHLRFKHQCRRAEIHRPPQGCPSGCTCGPRPPAERPVLKYFAVLPNYGQAAGRKQGGSREVVGYLQFVIDFWENLPNVVIFSQVMGARAGPHGPHTPTLPSA